MRFWTDGGFFSSVKGHVIKWWQLVILPVLHINNDKRVRRNEPQMQSTTATQSQTVDAQISLMGGSQLEQKVTQSEPFVQSQVVSKEENVDTVAVQGGIAVSDNVTGGDAMEILRRINEEKEEKRRQDVEKARKKAQEEARIAAIMNANKVDVDAFIEAGRAAKEEIASKKADDDALRRAQEIMDRLNREAAEDDAKKEAEIEAAKQEAKKQFG